MKRHNFFDKTVASLPNLYDYVENQHIAENSIGCVDDFEVDFCSDEDVVPFRPSSKTELKAS